MATPHADPIDELAAFFAESDYWKENDRRLRDPQVAYHEAHVESCIHPLALEYFARQYLTRVHGRDIRNVGHATVDDAAYIKIYPVDLPPFNFVWRHHPSVVIRPFEPQPFWTRTYGDERRYLEEFPAIPFTEDHRAAVDEFFASEDWKAALEKFADPAIEHFHVYLESCLRPRDLEPVFTQAMADAGYRLNIASFFLPRPDLGLMWMSVIPDGRTSCEVGFKLTPDVVLRGKELTEEERAYGGDGWTAEDIRSFIERAPYRALTLTDIDEVVSRLT